MEKQVLIQQYKPLEKNDDRKLKRVRKILQIIELASSTRSKAWCK